MTVHRHVSASGTFHCTVSL